MTVASANQPQVDSDDSSTSDDGEQTLVSSAEKPTVAQPTTAVTHHHHHHQGKDRLAVAAPSTSVSAGLVRTLVNGGSGNAFNHMYSNVSFKNTYYENGGLKAERINVTWNTARVQCSSCNEWFADEQAKIVHRRRFPSGCAKHNKCFAAHDNVMHAKHYAHNRCFVGDCKSEYREEDGWDVKEVEKHVRDAHGLQKRKA